MNLKVLVPFQVFADKSNVLRITATTSDGSIGILPHRLDCVAALVPGILSFETDSNGESYVAIDEGVLVKSGPDVLVCVRNAIGGTDLNQLRTAMDHEFKNLDQNELKSKAVITEMESTLMRRLAEFQDE